MVGSGTTNWSAYNVTLSQVSSPTLFDGSYAGELSSRTNMDSWIGQSCINNYLTSSGPGKYNVSAWVRSDTPGSKTYSITLSLYYGGTFHETYFTGTGGNDAWTLITGTLDVAWTGSLGTSYFITRQGTNTDNYYVDDCILSKQ